MGEKMEEIKEDSSQYHGRKILTLFVIYLLPFVLGFWIGSELVLIMSVVWMFLASFLLAFIYQIGMPSYTCVFCGDGHWCNYCTGKGYIDGRYKFWDIPEATMRRRYKDYLKRRRSIFYRW